MNEDNKSVSEKISSEFKEQLARFRGRILADDQLFMYSRSLKQICFVEGRNTGDDLLENIQLLYHLDNLDRFFVKTEEIRRYILFGVEYFMNDYPHSGLLNLFRLLQTKSCVHRDLLIIEYILLYRNHPYVEQLMKAGFELVIFDFLVNTLRDEDSAEGIRKALACFEKYFMKGSDISAITGLKRRQWHLLLKHAERYKTWINYSEYIQTSEHTDSYLEKMLRLDRNYGRLVYDIDDILAYGDEKGPFYTVKSLMSYLETLFHKQHLEPESAMLLLCDYLYMCEIMHVKPKIRSTSLEKDHDELSRLYNDQQALAKAGVLKEGFRKQKEKLTPCLYEDERLLVRVPDSVEDLVNEGNMNYNCVATYSEEYACGRTMISLIRKKEMPDKSYITVELDSDYEIIQASYSHNREINNKADLDFLQQWQNHCRNH